MKIEREEKKRQDKTMKGTLLPDGEEVVPSESAGG